MISAQPRHSLRQCILSELRQNGEIVSVFRFMVEHGHSNYNNGLRVFLDLEREGIISMSRLGCGRGSPWRVRLLNG